MKLMKFFATWCGPCKLMAPVVDEFVAAYPELEYEAVDIDQGDELARKYGIMSVPTVLLLDGEQELVRVPGFLPKQAFLSKLEGHL